MPNALRIGLLGPLQVRDETGNPVHVGGRQLRVLFTLLALNAGRVVPASSLAGQIWPDDPPGHPGNALQTLVSRLRAELRRAGLGHVIESHPAGYRLAVPPDAVDVMAFEALAAQGRRALAAGDAETAARTLREALSGWRGRPLADAEGCEFADVTAARLTELRASVLADRIEADLALGEGAGLVGELRALVSADPLAERPRAQLMRALYAAGRQADALAAYHEGRELLADRLGVDPSAQLEQVYLGILRGGDGLAAAASGPARAGDPPHDSERAAVPAPRPLAPPRPGSALTSFVGRDTEVSLVLKNLRAARLVTLTGPGGVGKTRLATEASGQLDVAAWFVPLAPVTDPAEVPYAVLEALGIREPVISRRPGESGATPLDRLTAAIGDRDEIMVLDNCEHVIEAAATLADRVLVSCPRMRILATSRQPLRIDGETLCPVPPLPVPPEPPPVPPQVPAVTVGSYESARLLRDRAAAVRPDFELDEGNAAAVARICRVLDGMPLAIELAAVWLRALTPAQLAGRLDDRFTLLTGGSRTALPRHRTLRAVVDWSWNLMSPEEQVLARRMALFPGGATLAAAEQVCADEILPSAAVLPALHGLVDKSILTAADGSDEPGVRYRMLETVRAYGLERLAETGEEAAVREAFTAYYLDLAETTDPKLRAAGQRRWLRVLGAEQDNLHAALRWVIARRDGDAALRFVRALGWYWMLRGQPGEPEALAREALALTPRERSARIAEARIAAAMAAAGPSWDSIDVQPVLAAAIAELRECAPNGVPVHPAAVMGEPMLAIYDGDPARAFGVFERYETSPDPWVRAGVPFTRGAFSVMLGRMDAAETDFRAALTAFRELGEAFGTSVVLIQLAELARSKGEYAAAIAALKEAFELGRQLGSWGDASHISGKLALVRLRTGDLAAARADLEQAEQDESARGIGPSDTFAWLGLVRAELHWYEGDFAAAIGRCEKLLAWIDGKPSRWWDGLRASIMTRLAMSVLAEGDETRCRALLADAIQLADGWIERPPLADAIDAVAVLCHRSGTPLGATLLGAAHSIRGCFDEGSLDARPVRDSLLSLLGPQEFAAAYERGRALSREDAVALAARTAAHPVTASPPAQIG